MTHRAGGGYGCPVFVGAGDEIEGKDGNVWLVVHADHDTGSLKLWCEARGLWEGKPSGPVKVHRLMEERATDVLRTHFPDTKPVTIMSSLRDWNRKAYEKRDSEINGRS